MTIRLIIDISKSVGHKDRETYIDLTSEEQADYDTRLANPLPIRVSPMQKQIDDLRAEVEVLKTARS